MRLLIIRHGESQADLLNVHEGRADFELTDRVSNSTAFIRWNWYKFVHRRPLAEFNNGLIAGLSREAAAEKYPYQPHLALHESVYEQESQLQFRYRAEHVLSKILSENKEGTIVVITHGGMIYQLYRAFLGLPINRSICVNWGHWYSWVGHCWW